ncbi:MAG: sulfate ABC transporter permease subunit CysW, partial [Victivallales bacterium]|nr:sulfate ABC transporter permease subunit CysW [Victivallales bacterium]
VVAESQWVRRTRIGLAVLHVLVVIGLPFASVLWQAFGDGLEVFRKMIASSDAQSAIGLTISLAVIALPLNAVFGVLLAWGVTHVRLPGRKLVVTLLELPFSVSPVVVGMLFILLFGLNGYLGVFLRSHGIKVIFAYPALLLVTLFVTMPFVARELIPLMSDGTANGEEEAARLLGASWWRIFWKITLPDIKWGLLYGMILSTARALGEFGAVAVVSGCIRGRTNTLPLHIEALFQDGDLAAASAAASLLALVGVVSLVCRIATARLRKLQERRLEVSCQ